MKIHRLRIDGFGNLRGEFIFSSDRCNLILEPNESGKSTLAEAILAGLYGLPRLRVTRERPITARERFRPWSGGPFRVEIDVEAGGEQLTIRRDFGEESVQVFEGLTGRDVTHRFSVSKDAVDVGSAVTGLARSEFVRCSFVRQNDMAEIRNGAGLTHALQRVASTQEGDMVAGEALELLALAVERDYGGTLLGKGKVDTEIKRLDSEIEEIRASMDGIVSRRREAEDKIVQLERASVREGRAESDLARVEHLRILAMRREVEEQLAECHREREKLEEYAAEMSRLEPYKDFPAASLGELRELKGRIDSLVARRAEAHDRLRSEVEAPLRRAESDLDDRDGLADIRIADLNRISNLRAVLQDLWNARRAKRAEYRRERAALVSAGFEPDRRAELEATFARLPDPDRAFLSKARERVLESRAALSEAEQERNRLRRTEGGERPGLLSLATARLAETTALLIGLGATAFAIMSLLSFQNRLVPVLSVLIAAAGFLSWMRFHERRATPGQEQFGSRLQKIQTRVWELEKESAALQDRLSRLASDLDCGGAESMMERYRYLEDLRESSSRLSSLAGSAGEIRERYLEKATELLEIMKERGHAPSHGIVTPTLARRFRDRARAFHDRRESIDRLRADRDTRRSDIASMDREIQSLRGTITGILESGLGAGVAIDDIGTALTRFGDACARRERYHRLAGELIPAAEGRRTEPLSDRTERLAMDLVALARQIESACDSNPDLASLEPDGSSREYEERGRRLRDEVRRTRDLKLALSEELGDVLREYRNDTPRHRSRLSALEAARRRAVQFRDAIGLAREALSGISSEAYAEWAGILNEKTSEILPRLVPGYENVRFDTDLSFSIRDSRTGRRLDRSAIDSHFSVGARDQIYLAVRMAVSDAMSTGFSPLPFILDDPLVNFDDRRFEMAMDFLMNTVAGRHQIILMSCHEERHRRWQERAAARTSDRVRLIDLTPLST